MPGYPAATNSVSLRWLYMISRVSDFFEFIGRAGLLARAIVYGLVSSLLLASAIAPGTQDDGYSPGDTFQRLETETGGQIVLIMICAGLIQYALWRVMQCVFDTSDEGNDASGILARIGMLMSGISYMAVGIAAGLVLLGSNSGDGGGTTETAAQFLLDQSFGRFLVLALGASVLVIGGIQTWRGFSRKWADSLYTPEDNAWICRAISFAISGRGLLILLIGAFILWAGIEGQAEEARGMSSTLGWLRQQPFGLWLYVSSALAIAGYGVYSLYQTVYLKIDFELSDLPRFARKTLA
ncbi:MAG: hypothetical protein CMK07_05100 [Ponticaulis sp.]|nr:hypothetical protein [Ponticaulis sp.]